MKNTTPEKNLEKFKKDFEKLLAKYPNIAVYGDVNGYIKAIYAAGMSMNPHPSLSLPSYTEK